MEISTFLSFLELPNIINLQFEVFRVKIRTVGQSRLKLVSRSWIFGMIIQNGVIGVEGILTMSCTQRQVVYKNYKQQRTQDTALGYTYRDRFDS